jgi:hypothetical protein
MLAVMAIFGGLAFVAFGALVTAVVSRGSMLRLLGFEVVTADGAVASRGRVLARTAIAWSPILVPVLAATTLGGVASSPFSLLGVLWIALAVLLAGAVLAIVSTTRGLQDRLAGTWLVPR